MNTPRIISVREQTAHADTAIRYIQSKWPEVLPIVYEDCISHSLDTTSPLPQWYLLKMDNEIIGCSGLITNDFISRMDLCPWICALYIEDAHRGNSYGELLLEKSKKDCAHFGFPTVYLATSHIGYYEKFGFSHMGQGYHPWGEESRIYHCPTNHSVATGRPPG